MTPNHTLRSMVSEWLCGATELSGAQRNAPAAAADGACDDEAEEREERDKPFEVTVQFSGADHRVMVRPSMTLPFLKRLIAATSLREASQAAAATSSVYPSVLIVRGRPLKTRSGRSGSETPHVKSKVSTMLT